MLQPDGSILISWQADGFSSIVVRARFRSGPELDAFARSVADVAILERTLPDLRRALRAAYPGAFDLGSRGTPDEPRQVLISFHPPRGEPNPDPE